jgi:hypothetical protein
MAKQNDNRVLHLPTAFSPRESLLFPLIPVLCTTPNPRPKSDVCRLIVDSRLPWTFEPIDANTSWLYLTETARERNLAGCLVPAAD